MAGRPKAKLPAEIERLCGRFEKWRSERDRGTRIPEVLWSEAAEAAAEHGVHRTARALGLDYAALKRRLEATGSVTVARSARAAPSFFELSLPAASAAAPACEIELETRAGAKARIRLEGLSGADLGEFARRFVEAAP